MAEIQVDASKTFDRTFLGNKEKWPGGIRRVSPYAFELVRRVTDDGGISGYRATSQLYFPGNEIATTQTWSATGNTKEDAVRNLNRQVRRACGDLIW